MLAGILVVAVSEAAARGRLGINSVAGIRTRAVMMTQDTWTAGHQAARLPVGLAGLVLFLAGVASVAFPLEESAAGPLVLACSGLAVVLVIIGAVVATRAANRALGSAEGDELS